MTHTVLVRKGQNRFKTCNNLNLNEPNATKAKGPGLAANFRHFKISFLKFKTLYSKTGVSESKSF